MSDFFLEPHIKQKRIILEEKTYNVPELNVLCPFCSSRKLDSYGHSSTCLGSLGGRDPNHHWLDYKCTDCKENFIFEYQGKLETYYGWYTQKGHCLKGINSCFEKYTYDCLCGGIVKLIPNKAYYSWTLGQSRTPRKFQCYKCNQILEEN